MDKEIDEVSKLPFCGIFIETPLDVCKARDTKILYKKVRSGNDLIYSK